MLGCMTAANETLGNVIMAGLIFARNAMWRPYYLKVMFEVYKVATMERLPGMVAFYSRRVIVPFTNQQGV